MAGDKGTVKYVLGLVALVVVIGLIGAYASLSLIGPKDLGVEYTKEDYNSAMEKTGMTIEFEGMTGEELEEFKESGGKESINDYNFEFSEYERKQFALTAEESTAL